MYIQQINTVYVAHQIFVRPDEIPNYSCFVFNITKFLNSFILFIGKQIQNFLNF